MPGRTAARTSASGRDLPDEESWRASTRSEGDALASLLLQPEAFAELADDERILCGVGMKGLRTARVLAERYAVMIIVRVNRADGAEYAAAARTAVRRVTHRAGI